MSYYDSAVLEEDFYSLPAFEVALNAWIVSKTFISSLIGTQLYPGHAPDKAQTPYVVSTMVGSDSEHCHDSRAFLNCRVQFSIFADKYSSAIQVRDAFLSLLDGHSGLIGTVDQIQVTSFHASTTSSFERDTRLHHIAIDFDFSIHV